MPLNDTQIERLCLDKSMISPFESRQISEGVISYGLGPMGYDIRLSRKSFKVFGNTVFGYSEDGITPSVIDAKKFNEDLLLEVDEADVLVIPPQGLVLARSVEYFKIPNNILALFVNKSTYARCGISCNVTPAQPGWEGHLTLEISNLTNYPNKIYPGEGICQAIFFGGEAALQDYRQLRGQYMFQEGTEGPKVRLTKMMGDGQ